MQTLLYLFDWYWSLMVNEGTSAEWPAKLMMIATGTVATLIAWGILSLVIHVKDRFMRK